jgi:hypothetical protein
MNKKFEKIAESLTEKRLQITANSLKEKYKPTVSKELERANRFAYELYFRNYQSESVGICEILEEENFTGNHNLWTWIQSALFLKCWILWKSNKESNRKKIENIIEIVNSTIEFGNDETIKKISKRVRDRRLNGSSLNHNEIENSIRANDKERELSWRIGQFKELLFIYFLGGSEEFPVERALRELDENEVIIRQLMI